VNSGEEGNLCSSSGGRKNVENISTDARLTLGNCCHLSVLCFISLCLFLSAMH
jgi:hypothetical protein